MAGKQIPSSDTVPNALTVDVEAWFHAHNLAIPPDQWDALPLRLDAPIDTLLGLLDAYRTTATFFVLGWIADRHPDVVRRIDAAGHEIATHGFAHRSVVMMTRGEFRDDVARSCDVLSALTGKRIDGYRAPRYSIPTTDHWAFDELESLGFGYDSSIFPVRPPHGRYGIPNAPVHPFRVRDSLWEFPLPVWRVLGRRIPVCAGAYLRLWPAPITRAAIRSCRRARRPVVVNVHPWELDPGQPRRAVGWRTRCVHYGWLATTKAKLEMLLSRHRFVPLRDLRRLYCFEGLASPQIDRRIGSPERILENHARTSELWHTFPTDADAIGSDKVEHQGRPTTPRSEVEAR